MARNEQVCVTKSPTGSKFSKNIFEQLYTGWTVVAHLCCSFSLWRQMAPQQTAKIRTAFFWSILYQFEDGLRCQLCIDLKTVFVICYGTDVLCITLNVLQICL